MTSVRLAATTLCVADEFEELIDRLLASIGEAVYEDPPYVPHPPASGESWVDLQPLVVAAASQGPASPEPLAHAFLEAVLHSPALGPQNRLTAEAFAFMLAAVPEELAISIRSSADPSGGQRWLQEHVWQIPGPDGARWLRTLAEADDIRANFLYQDMRSGRVPMWVDNDWPDRLDALVQLPAKPRPGIITMLPIITVPRVAGPALVRLLMGHGVDERDWLVRQSAANLRGLRRPDPAADVELVDWDECRSRPELFRWVLELMGEPDDRSVLVTAAMRAGAVSAREADWLAAPVDRPAWADGEVPWEVDAVVMAGEVIVPSGRLTGDDGLVDGRRRPVDNHGPTWPLPRARHHRCAPTCGAGVRSPAPGPRPHSRRGAVGARARREVCRQTRLRRRGGCRRLGCLSLEAPISP